MFQPSRRWASRNRVPLLRDGSHLVVESFSGVCRHALDSAGFGLPWPRRRVPLFAHCPYSLSSSDFVFEPSHIHVFGDKGHLQAIRTEAEHACEHEGTHGNFQWGIPFAVAKWSNMEALTRRRNPNTNRPGTRNCNCWFAFPTNVERSKNVAFSFVVSMSIGGIVLQILLVFFVTSSFLIRTSFS